MKTILIINGSGGKGKDSFVKFVSEHISTYNISSVDKVKEAGHILGWDGGKTEEDRLFLADMKFLSTRYNDQPYKYIKSCIDKFKKSSCEIMFIHIREPHEIDRVKNDFNCKTVFVENIHVKNITSNEADAHVSEYEYDYIIENNGVLDDLRHKAYEFVNKIMEVESEKENSSN